MPALSKVIITIREAIKVIESRDVSLKNYNNELMTYNIPSKLVGIIMKRMFKTNELTRRIMELHNNTNDLIYVCKSVYDKGGELGVKTPLLSEKYKKYMHNLNLK